ncbi:MAG: hypothetical protein CVU57_28760 [Deltaproteobacteria bacterium HGW-Deltaproteobacteria-15]|nr:MAG: hypothetical protein CVU57_28760 [Deltaproteobacteria bacterium HGW-Deltaproteobacteria-15]
MRDFFESHVFKAFARSVRVDFQWKWHEGVCSVSIPSSFFIFYMRRKEKEEERNNTRPSPDFHRKFTLTERQSPFETGLKEVMNNG